MADVTIPPPPSTVEEAVRLSNLMAYGFEKHQDIGYWNRYTEDPVYFWKRMLGWQAGQEDAPRFGFYANPRTPWNGGRMQDYRRIFTETLADFESPIVPKDQADAGKGQLLVRAGFKIYTAGDTNVGYIKKNPGQTQYLGVSVDSLKDKRDGSWDDYITDVAVEGDPNSREIRVTRTAHPAEGTPPYADWVEPTVMYTQQSGPMKLKDRPSPNPEPSDAIVIKKLDEIQLALSAMDQKLNQLALQADQNTEKIQTQIHDLVEDVEDSMKQVLPLITCRYQADPSTGPSGGLAGTIGSTVGTILGGLFARTRARRAKQ